MRWDRERLLPVGMRYRLVLSLSVVGLVPIAIAAWSLALGAVSALVLVLVLATWLSQRIVRPIAKLHKGALGVTRGDLEQTIEVTTNDEIGDLAQAFSDMTSSLKENQRRLNARMQELVALHDASRAVASEIDLDRVLNKIVDSVVPVLDARVCAIWLAESTKNDESIAPMLRLGAARARVPGRLQTVSGEQGADLTSWLGGLAAKVATRREVVRLAKVTDEPGLKAAAEASGIQGSLLATPLEHQGIVVGVIVIVRTTSDVSNAFSEADGDLLATFADQAAAAVARGRLYEEVRAFSEELEGKVVARTAELTEMNDELQRTITELRSAQSQLVLSERLAGLGLLVAGVAHDINSPLAAIHGSVVTLNETVHRLTVIAGQLSELGLSPTEWRELIHFVAAQITGLAEVGTRPPAQVKRAARVLQTELEGLGVDIAVATSCTRSLAELATDIDVWQPVFVLVRTAREPEMRTRRTEVLATYLVEYVSLHRVARTVRNGITRIQRIVGSLKRYSHLDQQAAMVHIDIHEGIENTLIILDHVLRAITVRRRFGSVPKIALYPDELNQVWTNLIHNAAQALQGRQGTIILETRIERGGVLVRIVDDGPGIPGDVIPNIFEPFFTTRKGEGTGIGLGIVQQIVKKHGGTVRCESKPGHTCFEVWLPGRFEGQSGQPPAGAASL